MGRKQQVGPKGCLEAALDSVSQDGDQWTVGWNKFWSGLMEDGLTIPKALDRALWAIPDIHQEQVDNAKDIFWTMFRSDRRDATEPDEQS